MTKKKTTQLVAYAKQGSAEDPAICYLLIDFVEGYSSPQLLERRIRGLYPNARREDRSSMGEKG
jgi:hypothetical protein